MKIKHLKTRHSVILKTGGDNYRFEYLFRIFDRLRISKLCRAAGYLAVVLFLTAAAVSAQQFVQPQYYGAQPNSGYLRNSSAFRQEIARFEITVTRDGFAPQSLTQIPRVRQGDVIKVRLLDEAVNGVKLDQSQYNWTLAAAFINPNRKPVRVKRRSARSQQNTESSVSEEIQFRKKGWYREYSFTVPYDSQPVFFFYPKPNYRRKIVDLINKNYNEIRKLGEKTIELAGAYARIGMFLNELQGVLSGPGYDGNSGYGIQAYGSPYSSYSTYLQPNYGYSNYGYSQSYNYNLLVTRSVERIARSFNIQLPQKCWQGGAGYSPSYGRFGNNQNGISPEMVNRLRCVAQNVRLEDFDLSVSRLLQQGGILLAAQLQQKYPQIAHWIGIAALAVDFIVKVFQKTAMRIVPTVTSSSDDPNPIREGFGASSGYQTTYRPRNNLDQDHTPGRTDTQQRTTKISVFAENQPDDNQFVTAYPLILHKWQSEPDPEIISLRPPVLQESCLHAGVNVLKSTDLTDDQLSDNFTRDYVLTMSSTNGFTKEFPLKKNIGLNGWELNISPQDLKEFPKIGMTLESTISGTRGFSVIRSPPFFLPIAIGGRWQITPESQREFTVGGRRTITIRNTLGNCQCLQAVIYRPSFGGQFVFETENKDNSLHYSADGKEVSFIVDAVNFQPGTGEIELRTFGGEAVRLPLKLYPRPPGITNLTIRRGDREGIISGMGLEQLRSVRINGRKAIVIGERGTRGSQADPNGQNYQNPNQAVPDPDGRATAVNTSAGQPGNSNERVFVFADGESKLTESTAALELELDDNRTVTVNQIFPVLPARPMIASNENGELVGTPITTDKRQWDYHHKNENQKKSPGVDFPSSTLLVEVKEITLNVQNTLTDHDFIVENLSIETRLEKSSGNGPNGFQNATDDRPNNNYQDETGLVSAIFEVLDRKNLRISFQLSESVQKLLGGRRLQFRIRDRGRGTSDWYTIKQTFVRTPHISSITCTNEMKGMCEMKGPSIDLISQVSIDGGQTWYPQSPAALRVQPMNDGQNLTMIPLLKNKKSLMIKLRDFPGGKGVLIRGFRFSNSVKGF